MINIKFTSGFILAVLIAIFVYCQGYSLFNFPPKKEPIFLGAHFGMSISDVKGSLKKFNALLVTKNNFKEFNPIIANKDPFGEKIDFEPIFTDELNIWKNTTHLYLPSIEMFGSQVIGKFNFYKNKLTNVEIIFYPLSKKNSSHALKKLEEIINLNYHQCDILNKPGVYMKCIDGKRTLLLQKRLENKSSSVHIYISKIGNRKQVIALRESEAFN